MSKRSCCGAVHLSANPVRRLRVSKRSRCGAVRICLARGEPFAQTPRVETLLLSRRAISFCSRRTLCGGPPCRSALAVTPCESVLSSANPLRRSCVLKRSRCGAVRFFCFFACESCLEVVSWFASLLSRSRVVSGSTCLAGCNITTHKSSTRSALPQLRHETRNFKYRK